MSPLSHAFSLHVPDKIPSEAYQIAREWLVRIGAKNIKEAPPYAIEAVFGTALAFAWKRKAKKLLHLEFQEADNGTVVHLGIELTMAHADDAAMFSGKILEGWQDFANEFFSLYFGGTPVSPAVVYSSNGRMASSTRLMYLSLGIAMFIVLIIILMAGLGGFAAYVLGGALIGGGVFLIAQGIIGREPAERHFGGK